MKTWRHFYFFVFVAIFGIAFAFTACKDDPPADDPKTQNAIITELFGNNSSATVTGFLTDTEWENVPNKIKTVINGIAGDLTGPAKDAFEGLFDRGIIIIVEKNPVYANWKTTNDGKTVYLNFNTVNGNDLQTKMYTALEKIYLYTEDQG